ncbi:MAG: L-fucose:H+ symporter permease [Prevotella sp.]|nr:L-fucose:H+ symporter permease [Prevotella sp.]MBR6997631.1 L-fucose:H+ symporter permease [Prevotella sp.]
MTKKPDGILRKDGVSLLVPFAMITCCFAMWGFANDVTNPMVKSYSTIFQMSVVEGSLVQVAFYLGYFVMAFPAAMFIQRYSFKAGVLMGLGLYAVGALAFIPARATGIYYSFLLAYFVMTCGLSFLETSCNPYIYCMGSEETATQRLNFAQSFNPIGAVTGTIVAWLFVQNQLDPTDSPTRAKLVISDPAQFEAIKNHDLSILIQPYVYIGIVVILLLLAIRLTRMPKASDGGSSKSLGTAIKELAKVKNYREGVIAQFFYIGAQVTCWTFIMHYGHELFCVQGGLAEKAASALSFRYYIAALVLFTLGRFICTWFLKFISPGRLLAILAVAAMACLVGVVLFNDIKGMYCLVAVSGCMSLMFPTIYGIALTGLGENVKFGGAGLIMSILGGSVLPPIQAAIMDTHATVAGLSAVHVSFVVPFICFIVVASYGFRTR